MGKSSDVDLLEYDQAASSSEGYGMDLVQEMVRFRQHPVQFIELVLRYLNGAKWRAYDPYIGARLYGTNWRSRILEHTLADPRLQQTMNRLVDNRMTAESDWEWTAEERDKRRSMYHSWINEMVLQIAAQALPTYDRRAVVRVFYFLTGQVLSRGYHQGVHIAREDIVRVRAKAAELEAKKQSLLLFPCHKSHMDYTVLVFAFYRLGLSLPATIAGENLDIAVLNRFLREVGATYIRRGNWAIDPLYTSFIQSLLNTYLNEGMNFQCFIEGTRSRTGKLLPPKFGILKFLLECIMSGRVEDAWVLPVSTQYDKVFEADQYATELLGRDKTGESFRSFLESSSFLSLRMGRVDIRFGEIWSLRDFIVDHLAQLHLIQGPPESVSLPLAKAPPASDLTYILRSLGYRILSDINRCSVVMPSALVGAVLLTTKARGLSHGGLVARVQDLVVRIGHAGGRIGAITKPQTDLTHRDIETLVTNALHVLGSDLVETEKKNLMEPVYRAHDTFKLSYYRNQIVHLFVSEAIVCLALYTLAKQSLKPKVRYSDLCEKAHFLSVLMSGEFVYEPMSLATNLRQTLERLEAEGVVVTSTETVEIAPNELRNEMATIDFYCYLVWPFIDGYLSVAFSLLVLPPGGPVRERTFSQMAHSIARTLYAQGELLHSEALNREVIRFALDHYVSQGMVRRTRDEARVTWIELSPEYEPHRDSSGNIILEGPLYEFAEEISVSRNLPMRYGVSQSITTRVLELCLPVARSITPRL